MTIIELIVCIVAGLGAGLGTGLAGLSAAAVVSPMLITFLHMPAYQAIGIAHASEVLASGVSAWTYKKNKNIDNMLKDVKTPNLLVINKIDKMEPEEFRRIYDQYEEMGIFQGIYGTSAKEGLNEEKLVAGIEEFLEEGPMYFPPDMVTDHPERFIVSEIIREKVLLYLSDEVHNGVAIEIESYREEGSLTRIGAVIYCERKSHKGIIIGKDGKKLKGIG